MSPFELAYQISEYATLLYCPVIKNRDWSRSQFDLMDESHVEILSEPQQVMKACAGLTQDAAMSEEQKRCILRIVAECSLLDHRELPLHFDKIAFFDRCESKIDRKLRRKYLYCFQDSSQPQLSAGFWAEKGEWAKARQWSPSWSPEINVAVAHKCNNGEPGELTCFLKSFCEAMHQKTVFCILTGQDGGEAAWQYTVEGEWAEVGELKTWELQTTKAANNTRQLQLLKLRLEESLTQKVLNDAMKPSIYGIGATILLDPATPDTLTLKISGQSQFLFRPLFPVITRFYDDLLQGEKDVPIFLDLQTGATGVKKVRYGIFNDGAPAEGEEYCVGGSHYPHRMPQQTSELMSDRKTPQFQSVFQDEGFWLNGFPCHMLSTRHLQWVDSIDVLRNGSAANLIAEAEKEAIEKAVAAWEEVVSKQLCTGV